MPLSQILPRAALVSKEYGGNWEFPAEPQRQYFSLFKLSGNGSVELGKGGGVVPTQPGDRFTNSTIIPTSEITITSSGTFVVVATQSTHDTAYAI